MSPKQNLSRLPLLADTLACSLPSTRETLLLRALVTNGAAQERAWQQWREKVGEPRTAIKQGRHELKELLPLLERAVERSSSSSTSTNKAAGVDGEWRTLLRFASAREELRDQTLRRVIGETLEIVRKQTTPVVVLGGVALAATVYTESAARHCGNLDLLIEPKAIAKVAAALVANKHAPPVWHCACSFVTTHTAGLPISLRGATAAVSPFDSRWQAKAFARSREGQVCEMAARVFAPDDMLLQTCERLFALPRRASLQLLCDAHHIVVREPALDWQRLAASACDCGLLLPLWLMLRYLACEAGTPVPPSVLEEMKSRLASESWRDARRAFKLARAQTGTKALLASAAGWRGRLQILALYLQNYSFA